MEAGRFSGVERHDDAVGRNNCASQVDQRRKATTFRVRQVEPAATKLGFQDAVFLMHVGDHVLLVTLEPVSDHGDEDVDDHGRSSDGRHDEMVRSSIHPTRGTSIR